VFGNPVFDRRETTTHVIVQDGQTVVLSGIVRQENAVEKRKLPLLGDLPLFGALFRSSDNVQRNRKLIAFITPRVVHTGADSEQSLQREHELLERVRDVFEQPDRVSPTDGDRSD